MRKMMIPHGKRYKRQMPRYAAADMKHDRSLLSFSTAKSFYNFDFSSGVLRGGYGAKTYEHVPSTATRYWVYRFYDNTEQKYVEQYIFQYANGYLALYNATLGKAQYISGKIFKPLDALNYRINSEDVLLLSCEGHKLMTWNGKNLTEYQNSPQISSMALHYERLFVTSRDERTKVFFSKNLDPTQWEASGDGGGFIELLDERGYLNKVVSFGSYLYIFRDHGISRVTAFGDQSEFSVVNMFVTAGRIYPSSIATCGNCIMFLASDGLYVFDGYECRRTLENISAAIEPNDGCACEYFNGKYYLACKINFSDDRITSGDCDGDAPNGLVVYDPLSGGYSLSRGLKISFMNACSYLGNDYLMCCESGKGGIIELGGYELGSVRTGSYWESALTDFGAPDKLKRLSKIAFYNNDGESKNKLIVGICVDGKTYTIPCYNLKHCVVHPYLSGYNFSFSLSATSKATNVTPLYVEYCMF